MNYPTFWKEASFRRKRNYSTLFIFIIAVLATLIGLLVPPSPQEAQLIYNQLNTTLAQGSAHNTLVPDIFLNNFPICLMMFIPLAGLGIGMFILFSTGQAFRAIFDIQAASGAATSTATNVSPATAFWALILVAAVFLFEYVSYSIAMTESVWLFRRILQNRWKSELKPLLILIGIVALLLIVGAIVETYAVTMPI
jgi:hypothetical protein